MNIKLDRWYGKKPLNWNLIKLKYVTSLRDEKTSGDSDLPYIGLEDIVSKRGEIRKKLNDNEYASGISNVFYPGDVLFGKLRPYLAKVYISEFKGRCTSELLVLNSVSRKLDGGFLKYLMISQKFIDEVNSSTYGTKMPRANWGFIGNIEIPLPGKYTQKNIVAFLDKKTSEIDALIADKEKLITLLEEKRQATITEAVTKGLASNVKMKDSGVEWIGEIPEHWEVGKLKHLFNIRTGGTPKSSKLEYWDDKGIIWITPGDLSFSGDTISDSYKKISEAGLINSSANYISENSIVMSTRAPIGNMKITTKKYTTNQGCKSLESKNNDHNIVYYFNLLRYRKTVLESLGQGSTFLELSSDNLKGFEVPVMGREEQDEIVEVIQTLNSNNDSILVEMKDQISKLKEYRQSLIYEAVTGKIDVQEMEKEITQEEVSYS